MREIVFMENLFVARIVRPMLKDVDGLPLVGIDLAATRPNWVNDES